MALMLWSLQNNEGRKEGPKSFYMGDHRNWFTLRRTFGSAFCPLYLTTVICKVTEVPVTFHLKLYVIVIFIRPKATKSNIKTDNKR